VHLIKHDGYPLGGTKQRHRVVSEIRSHFDRIYMTSELAEIGRGRWVWLEATEQPQDDHDFFTSFIAMV